MKKVLSIVLALGLIFGMGTAMALDITANETTAAQNIQVTPTITDNTYVTVTWENGWTIMYTWEKTSDTYGWKVTTNGSPITFTATNNSAGERKISANATIPIDVSTKYGVIVTKGNTGMFAATPTATSGYNTATPSTTTGTLTLAAAAANTMTATNAEVLGYTAAQEIASVTFTVAK